MKIEVLYQEVCCLFGDKGNPRYLAACLPEAEFVYTRLPDVPAFVQEDVAMIYVAAMSEPAQLKVLGKLMPYRERLQALMEQGCVILATGNAFELFGREIVTEKGETVPGLDLVPITTKIQLPKRTNSFYLGSFADMKIVGYSSRFANSAYLDGAQPLFTTQKGVGMDLTAQTEGVRKNNFFGTHLLGPLLIMNPDFVLYLQRLMGVENPKLAWEKEIRNAYEIRLAEYSRDIEFD